MPVSGAFVGREPVDHHIGPELPDPVHQVFQDLLFSPQQQGFIGRFGKTEVYGTGEILLPPVNFPGFEQLVGTDQPHVFILFRTNEVLAAVAACHGIIGRSYLLFFRKPGD
ncbi:hypothetical protein D9M69_587520 [compost metagenome]